MANTGSVVNSTGDQIGVAADLANDRGLDWEWWAVASATYSASTKPKQTANLFASFATLFQVAGAVKAYGELSSATFLPVGVSVTATSSKVATIEVMPGPKITYDSVKLEATTNRAYINSITKIKLSDAEARDAVASAKAVLSEAKKMRTSLSSSVLKAQVTQLVQA